MITQELLLIPIASEIQTFLHSSSLPPSQPLFQSLVPPTTHPLAAVLVCLLPELTCQKAETDQSGNEPRELHTASGEDQNDAVQHVGKSS